MVYAIRRKRALFYAWLLATLLSGIPSTLYALVTGGDPLEATRAAGAMVTDADAPLRRLFVAAALVHATVSLFWAFILWVVLPNQRTVLWALAASAGIALFDLQLMAPTFFPEVAALEFWPQFADHLMWGACVGYALARPQR